MKKKLLCVVLAVLMSTLLILSACDNSSSGNKRDDIKFYINGDITALDPANSGTIVNSQVMIHIYDYLVRANMDHTVEPRLAKEWKVSDDLLTYTFYLQQGVKFHNGEEMKARDVVFTMERAMESPYQKTVMEKVESVSEVDEYTVEFKLSTVFAPFLESVAGNILICNEKAVTEVLDAGGVYGEKPIGTGAYKFVNYVSGTEINLTRFDDYFRGPARIKDVNFRIISDPNTYTIAVQNGEVDLGAFAPTAYGDIKNNENLVIYESAYSHFTYVMFNNEAYPFDNKLVRQAVNYAMDREFMVQTAASGLAKPNSNYLNSTVLGWSDNVPQYTYNPEKAKELLAQAGIQTPIDIGVIKTISGSFNIVAQALQQNLADIGINAEVEMLEPNKYIEDCLFGNFVIGMMGIDCGYDADNFGNLFDRTQIDGGNNMGRYANEHVEDLFAQARSITDVAQRTKIYDEIFTILYDEAPYAVVLNQYKVLAYNKDLQIDYINPNYYDTYEMAWK